MYFPTVPELSGQMPVPTKRNKSKLSRQSQWGIIVVAKGVVIVLAVVVLRVRWKQFRQIKGEEFASYLA